MKRKRATVYLSGGMQFAAGNGADWRRTFGEWVRSDLGHTVLDPVQASMHLKQSMRRSGHSLGGRRRVGGSWPIFFRRVVDQDVRLVARRSDYVVCLWNLSARKGAGTQGELTVARWLRIPVYLVSRTPRERLPGWVQGCITEHFHTFEQLKFYLRDHYPPTQRKGVRS